MGRLYKHNPYAIVKFKMFTRKQKIVSGLVTVFTFSSIFISTAVLFLPEKAEAAPTQAQINSATFEFISNTTIRGNFGAAGSINFSGPAATQGSGGLPYYAPTGTFCTPVPGPSATGTPNGLLISVQDQNPLAARADMAFTIPDATGNCSPWIYRQGVAVTFDYANAQGSRFTEQSIRNSTYVFGNNANVIIGTFPGVGAVNFIDDNAGSDSDRNYKAVANRFCGQLPWIGMADTTDVEFDQADSDLQDIPLTVRLSYFDSSGECRSIQVTRSLRNNNQASVTLRWDGEQIRDISSGSFTLSIRNNDTTRRAYVSSQEACPNVAVILDQPRGNTGLFLNLNNGEPDGDDPPIARTYFPNCGVDESYRVTIAGTYGQDSDPVDPDPGDDDDSGETADDEPSCEKTYNSGLEWLLCGLISQFDKITQGFNEIIEEQLDFNVEQNLNENVEKVWSTFRIIASSLLLIVALIMVFGQAINWGPFDAYSVRKLLPRLIAAIILIQLSWQLGILLITIANDAGKGIADIMYAPFGGASQVSLENSLAELGYIGSLTFLGAMAVGAIGGLVFLGPFGIILVAFSIFIAIFTALLVLLFREILIVFCMILAPIALIAWILPGTQKYFNLWWDTFVKLLIMFPLIIALIAAGRIFAEIASSSSGDAGLIDFMAVVLGFFGVYFLLPKTFQWGGRLLGNVAGSVNNNRGLIERPKKLLQDRQGQYKAAKSAQASHRRLNDSYDGRVGVAGMSVGMGNFGRRIQRGVDKGRLGEYDPTRLVARDTMEEERRKKDLEQRKAGIAYGMREQTFEAQKASLEGAERKQLADYAKLKFEGVSLHTDAGAKLFRDAMDSKNPDGSDNYAEIAAALGAAFNQRAEGLISEADRTRIPGAFQADGSLYPASAHRIDLQPQNVTKPTAQVMAESSEKQLGDQHKGFYVNSSTGVEAIASRMRDGTGTTEDVAVLRGIRSNIEKLASNSNVNATITPEIEAHINNMLTTISSVDPRAGATTYREMKEASTRGGL